MMRMATLRFGDRIGKEGKISLGASAVILDASRKKILLTRRTDNGRWCLPSGRMEPGESIEEACMREVLEETGLIVHLTRLVGIYSNPNILVEYADGNKIHVVSTCFEAAVEGGTLTTSDETTEFGYFTAEEIQRRDLMENQTERIADAFAQSPSPFLR